MVDLRPGAGAVAAWEGAAAVSGQDREALVLAERPPGVAVPGTVPAWGSSLVMRTVLMRWSAPPQRSASRAGTQRAVPGLRESAAGRNDS